MRRDWFFLVLLIILALVGVKALFQPGFYTNHDGEHQVVRLWHFHKGLIDGQLPVRWAGTALKGFGYPLFIFTYRLPFWLGEFFYRLGLNLTDSIKAVFILTFLASGLTMYFFAQDLWKSKLSGFLCAFLYLWAPYRFLNIFVRASLGEHVAFVFLPLIFWGLWRLKEEQKFAGLLFAIASAGLILSHALIFQLLVPFIFIFWLGLFLESKRRLKFLGFSFLSALLFVGLSSYYLLPALFDKKLILSLYPFSFSGHFPTLKQLLYSPWDYGFSLTGPGDGMAFQLGVTHWLVVAGVVFFLFLRLFKKRKDFFKENLLVIVLLFLFSLSILMISSFSLSLWERIFKIIYLDFSWRLLFMAVFTSSLLAGFLVKTLKDKKFLLPASCFLLFTLNLYANRNHLRVNKYVFNPDSFYQENQGTTNSFDEYTPKWAVSKMEQWKPGEPVVLDEKTGTVKIKQKKSNLLEFVLENNQTTDVVINTVYYPGWQVSIDGQSKEIVYEGNGLINLRGIEPGKHQVIASFKETPLRKVANSISLVSLLLTALVLLRSKKA